MILLASRALMRNSPSAMPLRRLDRSFSLGRFCLAGFLALVVAFAALLSVAPHLHERLHPDAIPSHLCIVTIFAAGQCEASTATPVVDRPAPAPVTAAFTAAFATLPAVRFFTLLEHAPPALA